MGEPLFRLLGRRRTGREVELSKVKRVLVVRLDEIGDVVMTTPLIRELRRNLPDAQITLVVKPQVRNLVELCPYVDEILIYDWNINGHIPWHNLQLRRHGRALRLAWKYLWKQRFDLVIVPRWDADPYHASFVAYFSGAPWRVGYSSNVTEHKRRLNRGYDRLFSHVLDDNKARHEVEHNLDVLPFLSGNVQEDRMELWVGQEDESFAQEVLRLHGVNRHDLLVAFGPGAGARKRLWSLPSFVKLEAWLKKEYGAHIVLVGGPGEEQLGQELHRQLGDRVINVVGRTTLRQTVALLKRCHLYVGNDAGPMHLAAAIGTPVVEISCHPLGGSPLHENSPSRFGPRGVPYSVIQPENPLHPCFDACIADQAHCILGIGVEKVKEAVEEQLSKHAHRVVLGVSEGAG